MLVNIEYENYLPGTKQMCLPKAKDYYQCAFEEFKAVDHLMGKYLSKRGEKRNYIVDEDESDEEVDEL